MSLLLDFNVPGFEKWLKDSGADVLPPTNPYEVIRFRACGRTEVIYQNKVGDRNCSEFAAMLLRDFGGGRERDLHNPKEPARALAMPITPNNNLRDIFAGQAMQGMVMGACAETDGYIAQRAYAMADAMLKAREAK